MSKVNIDKLYLATVTQDDLLGLVFETPEYIPGVRQIDGKPKTNNDVLYAEGRIWEQENTLEGVTVDLDLAELGNAQYAKYLGHNVATLGGVYVKDTDRAPDIAILYVATKGNGKKAYRVYYKGKLTEPDENAKGKEGKTDYQTHKAQANFQSLKNNGLWLYKVDEDDLNCPVDIADTFFTNVYVPTSDITVPVVTSVPLAAAVGVLPAANIVFTFSTAIQPSTITDGNVFLTTPEGVLTATTLSVDVTNKIVTMHPVANMAAGTYIAVCTKDVKNAAGIPIAANKIVSFTV